MSKEIRIQVNGYSGPSSPTGDQAMPQKTRFFVKIGNIPSELVEWMSTNPREQNLGSPVAKAISASLREDSHDFHLKNRGVLLSAESVDFIASEANPMGKDGRVTITFSDPALHGNVDGGHTLRLILAAQESGEELPEQYVEFEVITGLTDLLPVAEARNASVALDMKSMEAMKGSFDVLKSILGPCTIGGDHFFDRVELKMNEQLGEENRIDIRSLIAIILMFNKTLFPNDTLLEWKTGPHILYGKPEIALNKYLSLGGGDPELRKKEIEAMSPILLDILALYDIIEKELPLVKEKQYAKLPFATRRKNPKTLFSNEGLAYAVPQSVVLPILSGFRGCADIGLDGHYFWRANPFAVWAEEKKEMAQTFMGNMKDVKNAPDRAARTAVTWHFYIQIVELARLRMTGKN